MTQSLHPSAAKGFGSGAELYQQVRPSYPQEIAIWLDEIAPFEADTPRYHSEKWKQVFENQELFRFIGLDTFQLLHRGTVEQVVSKRLLSTSFIAAMPAQQQQELKARFEQIVFDFTGLTAQDQIDFPYTTFAYHFQKTSNSL